MNKTGQPCPFSGCGSSDAFSWHTEKQVGKCFSCGESYPHKGMAIESWAAEEYPLKDNYKMDDMTLKSQQVFPDNTPSDGLAYKEFRGISPADRKLVQQFTRISGSSGSQRPRFFAVGIGGEGV